MYIFVLQACGSLFHYYLHSGVLKVLHTAGPWAPCLPVGSCVWLVRMSGTFPEAVPVHMCLCMCCLCTYVCMSVYVSAYVSQCVHMCVLLCMCPNKPTLESFIIGPVSALSLPKGKKVEMRDRKMHGRAPCTHGCHTPVPNGRHAGHYDVFQMDTSVCFPRNKSAKSRERVVNKLSLVFYLFIAAIAICLDVMIYLQTFRDTSRTKKGDSGHMCYDVNTVLETSVILCHLTSLLKWQ